MVRVRGENERDIPSPLEAVWAEAVSLEWLIAPDAVRLDAPAAPGTTFALKMDDRTVSGTFTRVEPGSLLEWEAENGSSGILELSATATGTHARCVLVDVPMAAVDRLAVGAISLLARKKAQRMTNDDVDKDLRALATRAHRRVLGQPVNAGSWQMLGVSDFGDGSWEPDTVPAFDAGGNLVLAQGESILTRGRADAAVAETAEGAGGKEQFSALWPVQHQVDVILTSDRLVYRLTDVGGGDPTWLVFGGGTGLALTAVSYRRAAHARSGKAIAGQVRHRYVANIITGTGDRIAAPDQLRLTATLLVPPKTIIRTNLFFSQATDFAAEWVRAVATERLRDKPVNAEQDDDWQKLDAQAAAPTPIDGYWGPMYKLPRYCPIGAHRPHQTRAT